MSSVASHTHHHQTKHNAAIEFCIPESNQKASLHAYTYTPHTDLLKFKDCLRVKRPLNLANTFSVCIQTATTYVLTDSIKSSEICDVVFLQLNVVVCVNACASICVVRTHFHVYAFNILCIQYTSFKNSIQSGAS